MKCIAVLWLNLGCGILFTAHVWAAQPIKRALGLVRHRAKEWGINPQRIGVLGFSAGGNLSAELCANYGERAYPTVDDADTASCRPDFQILMYPAYLVQKDDPGKIAPRLR